MLWHSQVEQKNVRLQLPRQSYGFGTVGSLTQHLQIRFGFQKAPQAIPENWMVVGDYDTNRL
jgi:hypothetical protein